MVNYRTKWKPKYLEGNKIIFKPIDLKDYRYDSEGNIVNNKTGQTGTLALPELVVNSEPNFYRTLINLPSTKRQIEEKRLNDLISHSEIDPVTGHPRVIGLKSVYPEFDVISGFLSIKPIRHIFDIGKRKVTFTGVPYRLKDGKFMDESFLNTTNDFDIWTSDNPDFVRLYAGSDGLIFSIFGKPHKLYNLPKLKKKVSMLWLDMPYIIKDGKIDINPSATPTDFTAYVYDTPVLTQVWRTPVYPAKNKYSVFPIPQVTTDLLLKAVPSKYQGIKFRNIFDGPTITSEGLAHIPVNEWVYRSGADVIKAPFGTTKYDLIRNDLINLLPKGINITTLNVLNNDK